MSEKKTKKTGKKQEAFRPGTEKREVFSLVLSTISKLLDEKKIGIEVDSSGVVEFSLSPSTIKKSVSKILENKLSFEDFMNTISTEIESLLEASSYCDKAKGIEEIIPTSILKDVGLDEFLWRLGEIEKVINIPKALKQDSIFKKTTKGRILKGIKWETNNKTFDEQLGKLENCKYATLSIIYSQPRVETFSANYISNDYRIELPTVAEPKHLTLELQKKDITKMIDHLQQILETF